MKFISFRAFRGFALIFILGLTSACGLPNSGPTRSDIFAGSTMREGNSFILTVDNRVNAIIGTTPELSFSAGFDNASALGSDTINPGDILGLTVWENVRDPLLATQGQNAMVLEELQVDGAGFIFVPYAGRIRAAGNTPETLRRVITQKLEEQTPDPQVQVRRLSGDGSTISIVGSVSAQGVYPIERPTRTLASMIARAGGATISPEIAKVTLVRGGYSDSIWLGDLYARPDYDIALRPGDRIFIEQDTRSFTALGATQAQSRVAFESQTISALEAIGQVGGLNTNLADPTGVFVFRNESEEITEQLVGRNDLTGIQRVVYVLDLTETNGIFVARDFIIRDGDTIFITEAPFSQFNKVISTVFGTLGQVNAAANIGQ